MTAGTEKTNGREPSAEVCVTETEIGAEDRVRKLEDCVTGDEDCREFHKLNPDQSILFPEYCFLYLHQRCYFKYTVYVYVEELFALAENNKNGRLALPCALRSHDYHVTGSANQNADMQIKYKKRGKIKQIE